MLFMFIHTAADGPTVLRASEAKGFRNVIEMLKKKKSTTTNFKKILCRPKNVKWHLPAQNNGTIMMKQFWYFREFLFKKGGRLKQQY